MTSEATTSTGRKGLSLRVELLRLRSELHHAAAETLSDSVKIFPYFTFHCQCFVLKNKGGGGGWMGRVESRRGEGEMFYQKQQASSSMLMGKKLRKQLIFLH